MTDDKGRKRSQAARLEYPQTEAAFGKVRDALIARLLSTPLAASQEREKLYFAVQTLDAVKSALSEMMALSSDDIESYIDQIAATS